MDERGDVRPALPSTAARSFPGDVCESGGVPHTSATRSALDLTMITDVEHSLPVLDYLLHVGAVQHRDLCRGARGRTVWPYTLSTEIAVRLADCRSESVGESRSRYMFWRGGLPTPLSQYAVVGDHGGTVARLDFAWPELGRVPRVRRQGQVHEAPQAG